MHDVTSNQLKILYLIYKWTCEKETKKNIVWIKELPLLTLVYEGIKRKLFLNYDYAPYLVTIKGVKHYANVSQEYIKDMDFLVNEGMVRKLKLNTRYYDNINAYTINAKHRKFLKEIDISIKKIMDNLISCPGCNGRIDLVISSQSVQIICNQCSFSKQSDFFKLENIPYRSVAYFSGGGR